MPRFLTDEGRAALIAAARAVETGSAAEVVVAVEPRAGRQLGRSAIAGTALATAALAAMLYAPPVFELHWILVDTLLAGAAGALLADRVPWPRRRLGRRAPLVPAVRRAAAEGFLARGVHHTRGRTGVLVHVSLAERVCVAIGDAGVRAAVAPAAWRELERSLDAGRGLPRLTALDVARPAAVALGCDR